MKAENVAEVIETSPVRLTSDETRAVLRCSQSLKPVRHSYSRDMNSLLELGLVEKVPMETPAARQKRLNSAWASMKVACAAKDSAVAASALKEISEINRTEDPEMGYVLTEIGKQVARGITVRIVRR
jgi:hypothetical protein